MPTPERFRKFDARLELLHRLAPQELRAIWLQEREPPVITSGGSVPKGRPRLASITAGIHYPGTPTFPADFPTDQGPVFSLLIWSDGSAEDLATHGARVRSRSGDVFVAAALQSSLAALHGSSAVRFIELASALRPQLAVAGVETGLTTLQTMHRGTGVLVGVVDQFLDFRHPDFAIGGNSRVLALWDQTLGKVGGEQTPRDLDAAAFPLALPPLSVGLDYGVEYRRADIQTDLAAVPYSVVRHEVPTLITGSRRDQDGGSNTHGTHVAGIAVGNGSDGTNANVGAAPEADLIFVHHASVAQDEVIADANDIRMGASFVFERARQAGQACVLNLSLGDGQGPHDGTSLGEKYLDGLLDRPGRAIVVAAGNDNNRQVHDEGDVLGHGTEDLVVVLPSCAHKVEELQIWYPGSLSWTLEVRFVQGTTDISLGSNIQPGDPAVPLATTGTIVDVKSVLHDPRNGDNLILVLIRPSGTDPIREGKYHFVLTSQTADKGTYHAWLTGSTAGARFDTATPDDITLDVPATACQVITVAEHRMGAPGNVPVESGRGKSRDGRDKPDLAAPTGMQSANSRNRRRIAGPTYSAYTGFSGTSASAPFVAGLAALIFECWGGGRSWDFVRDKLRGLASMPGGAAAPDTTWGWGKLDPLKVPKVCDGSLELALTEIVPTILPARPELQLPFVIPQNIDFPLSELEPDTQAFEIDGLGHGDGIELRTSLRQGSVEIEIPLAALHVRDEAWLARHKGERPLFGEASRETPPPWDGPDLDQGQAYQLLDIEGARRVQRAGDVVRVEANARGVLFIPRLRLARGAKPRFRVTFRGARPASDQQPVTLNQFRNGRWISSRVWTQKSFPGGPR